MPICKSLSVPYKLEPSLTLLSVQTVQSQVESIESYNELLNTAKAGLEDHLERMDETLSLHFTRSEADNGGAPEHGKVSTDLCPAIQTQ
jgi:hypothetical protein